MHHLCVWNKNHLFRGYLYCVPFGLVGGCTLIDVVVGGRQAGR